MNMNCNTGELMMLRTEQQKEELKKLGFKEVPDDLKEEAFRELHEKERVFVDMNKNTPLVKWAKQHKTGRNEPCPCGSERKYKNCCLHRDELLNNPQPPKGE